MPPDPHRVHEVELVVKLIVVPTLFPRRAIRLVARQVCSEVRLPEVSLHVASHAAEQFAVAR